MVRRKVLIEFEVDADGAVTDVKSLNKAIDKTGESVDGASGSLKNFGMALAAIGVAGTAVISKGLIDLGISAVKTGALFETLGIQMETAYGGNVAAAQKATEWVKEFANVTTLQLEESTQAFIQLKTVGIDPMAGAMEDIVDASSKAGGGSDRLNSIVLALTKSYTMGKLQMQEMNMMLDRQIPVIDILAKRYGVSTEKIAEFSRKGMLTRDVILELIDAMGEWGSGAQLALMDSLTGKISIMEDAWANLQDQFARGVMPAVKDGIDIIIAKLEEMGESGAIEQLGEKVGETLSKIIDMIPVVVEFGQKTTRAIMDAVTWISKYRDEIITAAKVAATLWVITKIMAFVSMIGKAVIAITGLKTIMMLAAGAASKWAISQGLANTAVTAGIAKTGALGQAVVATTQRYVAFAATIAKVNIALGAATVAGFALSKWFDTWNRQMDGIDGEPIAGTTAEITKLQEAVKIVIGQEGLQQLREEFDHNYDSMLRYAKQLQDTGKFHGKWTEILQVFNALTKESGSSVTEVTASVDDHGDAIKAAEKQYTRILKSIGDVTKATDKYKKALKDLNKFQKLVDKAFKEHAERAAMAEENFGKQQSVLSQMGDATENLAGMFNILVASQKTAEDKAKGFVKWIKFAGEAALKAGDNFDQLSDGISGVEDEFTNLENLGITGETVLTIGTEIEIPPPPEVKKAFGPVAQAAAQSFATAITDALLMVASGEGDVSDAFMAMFEGIAAQGAGQFEDFLSQAMSGGITDESGKPMGFFDAIFSDQGTEALKGAGLAMGIAFATKAKEEGDVVGGVIGGAMAGAAVGGVVGAVVGGVIGGIVAAMASDVQPRVGLNITPFGANVAIRDQDQLSIQEMDLLRANIMKGYRTFTDSYRDIIEMFGRADFMEGFTLPTFGYETDEMMDMWTRGLEGELDQVLDWLFNIGMPEAFESATAGIIRRGLTGLKIADVAVDFLFEELGRLPADERLQALANFIETAVNVSQIIREASFEAIKAETFESSVQAFMRGTEAIGDQIRVISTGLEQLPLLDRAREISDIVGLMQQAGQGLQNFIKLLQQVRDSIDQMIEGSIRQLTLGGMDPQQQLSFFQQENADLMRALETGIDPMTGAALSPERIQEIVGQMNQNIMAMAQIYEQLGMIDELVAPGTTDTFRDILIGQLEDIQALAQTRIDEIEEQGRQAWEDLRQQLYDTAAAMGFLTGSIEDATSFFDMLPQLPDTTPFEDLILNPGQPLNIDADAVNLVVPNWESIFGTDPDTGQTINLITGEPVNFPIPTTGGGLTAVGQQSMLSPTSVMTGDDTISTIDVNINISAPENVDVEANESNIRREAGNAARRILDRRSRPAAATL